MRTLQLSDICCKLRETQNVISETAESTHVVVVTIKEYGNGSFEGITHHGEFVVVLKNILADEPSLSWPP